MAARDGAGRIQLHVLQVPHEPHDAGSRGGASRTRKMLTGKDKPPGREGQNLHASPRIRPQARASLTIVLAADRMILALV